MNNVSISHHVANTNNYIFVLSSSSAVATASVEDQPASSASPPVMSALLEMGFDVNHVKKAIKETSNATLYLFLLKLHCMSSASG